MILHGSVIHVIPSKLPNPESLQGTQGSGSSPTEQKIEIQVIDLID